MSRLQGTLNKPNYFGNKDDRRYFVYIKIQSLFQHNPLNAPLYIDGYWNYTFKVNIWPTRKTNAGKAMKSRYIHLFPWKSVCLATGCSKD